MRISLFVLAAMLLCIGCWPEEEKSYPKFYDFYVVNQLPGKVVKIVPKSQSRFWVYAADTFRIRPNQKIIIGSRMEDDNETQVKDIYDADSHIERFEVLVQDEVQSKDFGLRSCWVFIPVKPDISAIYKLIIDENSLKQ